MKTVVSLQDLVDYEIRPGALFSEFHALTQSSVEGLAAGPLADAPCPGCRSAAASKAFVKFGLTYQVCDSCGSLYVSPRPSRAALEDYAKSSPASIFWRERVFGETQHTRLVKLIRPRVEWVVDTVGEYGAAASAAVDLSPQGPDFVEELAARAPWLRNLGTGDPHAGPSDAPESLDFVTAFDALGRSADVPALVDQVWTTLRPGGLFFVTAPCISGFDLQVLWDRSPTILPPDKLNLLSLEGFGRLFSAPAWDVIELSTPGMFDVENVRQAMLAAPGAAWPRIVHEMVLKRDETARLELQEYLQRHRLASFARLVARRR